MATIYYSVYASDSTVVSGDPSKTGLTPTWASLKTTGGVQTDVSSLAVISAVGGGQYQIAYDAEANGEASGVLDLGSGLVTNTDRYIPVSLAKDSSRIQAGINASGKVTADLTQAIPLTNTANTLGDCLNAARSQGFGSWNFDTNTLILTVYAPDGTTPVRVFTVDSATDPTSRT